MKKIFSSALLIFSVLGVFAQQSQSQEQINKNQRYFNINKSLDIFTSVIRELDMFYVDSVKVDSLVENTIRRTLNGIDPYTEFYSEDDMDDFNLMTKGEYAGIGAIISQSEGSVIINEPYEGLPADKAGLKAGDRILEIDGKDVTKLTTSDVSDKLKGTPGTTIQIKIQRPGEKKPKKLTIVRENIVIPAVTYSNIVNNNTGYIHFASFTQNSSSDFKKSFEELKNKGAESLIIDLRGNGGGILEEAVSIVNMFVPKGQEIVSTRGKVKQWDRVYSTQNQPVDELIPLVVLTDTGSASASEIVAGALQDLDRAVIIGNRTFGKGLVQTTRQLPYDGTLKVTTAKYYIPSGRLIQVLDYSHRNPDGTVARVPDSLTNIFYTKNGREVRDGGGITPDIQITDEKIGTIAYYLVGNNIIFDYVTEWVQSNPTIAPPDQFEFPDADYESFKEFVKSKDFKYDQMSVNALKSLKSVMEFEGYMESSSEEYKALETKLVPNLDRDLETFKKDIVGLLNNEIVKRYYYSKGMLINELQNDEVFAKALEVLKDKVLYNSMLQPKKTN
ncbi:MAG: S41 family peptidase [Dysgonamonadaceae bacterium]